MLNKDFETLEEGMKELKKGIGIRNEMGGALYWNVLNDECCQIGNKLLSMGGNYDEIAEIIGRSNFH